jgi:uncharacterized repeat protein (TIGR01451 family)
VPANTTFVDANNGGQVVQGSVRWVVPQLGPGQGGNVQFRVRINQGVSQGTVIQNQGRLTGPAVPQPILSNVVSTTVSPPAQVQLTLTKQVDKQSAPVGETLTYTLTFANNGPQTFTQLVIADPIPQGATFQSANNGGQLVGNEVRWQLPPVGPGANGAVSFTVRINANAPEGAVIQNRGQLSSPEISETILSNTVATTVTAAQIALTLNKQVDRATAQPGETLTYTLTYANNGSQTFDRLFIQDALPENTTFIDATQGGVLLVGSVRWTVEPVPPGATGTLQFRVQVNQGVPAGTVIPNQAQLGGGSANPFPPILSPRVTTTVTGGGGQPPTSFAGTWFAVPPTGHAVSLTVDSRNRFTLWAVSADRSTVQRSAQGTLNADGSFNVFSADQQVQFTGQVAANGQSATIEVNRHGILTFGVTAPRAPDVNPLPADLVGTWNGFGVAANGDRMQVRISTDPGGNATFHGEVVREGSSSPRHQFAHFYITPNGQVIDPAGNQQVGTLQLQGNQVVLSYFFQHSQPPPYQNTFQVTLQPLP